MEVDVDSSGEGAGDISDQLVGIDTSSTPSVVTSIVGHLLGTFLLSVSALFTSKILVMYVCESKFLLTYPSVIATSLSALWSSADKGRLVGAGCAFITAPSSNESWDSSAGDDREEAFKEAKADEPRLWFSTRGVLLVASISFGAIRSA